MRLINGWSQDLLLGLLGIALCAIQGSAQRRPRGEGQEGFRFRFVGPTQGNRISSVAGIAGDPSTYYAGAASGGAWKSTDGGNRTSWFRLQSRNCLLMAPSYRPSTSCQQPTHRFLGKNSRVAKSEIQIYLRHIPRLI